MKWSMAWLICVWIPVPYLVYAFDYAMYASFLEKGTYYSLLIAFFWLPLLGTLLTGVLSAKIVPKQIVLGQLIMFFLSWGLVRFLKIGPDSEDFIYLKKEHTVVVIAGIYIFMQWVIRDMVIQAIERRNARSE